ncbi:hypothetical protein BaRGS_00031353, partial [Batillaria attramentaria]
SRSIAATYTVPCNQPLPVPSQDERGRVQGPPIGPSGEGFAPAPKNASEARQMVIRVRAGSEPCNFSELEDPDKKFPEPVPVVQVNQALNEVCAEGHAAALTPGREGKAVKRGSQEADSPTFHVLDNQSVVKYAPGGNSARGGRSNDQEESVYEGRTITLVEDENNVGTFKIAGVGDDNSVTVISNDRIVVFDQDPNSASASSKQAAVYGNEEAPDEAEQEESTSSFIRRSINTLNNDRCDVAEDYHRGSGHVNGGTDGVAALEGDGSQDGYTLRNERAESYGTRSGGGRSSDAQQTVQTFANTSIMRPLHNETGYSAQHYASGRGSSSSTFPATVAASHGGSQTRSWASYPSSDRESTSLQHHYPSEASTTSGYTTLPGASGGAGGAAPTHPHGYPGYTITTSSTNTTPHQSSYSEVSSTYPSYLSQINAWPAAGGHGSVSHLDSMVAYAMSDAEKMGIGYAGHPHAAAFTATYTPGYLPPSPAAGYLGYGIDGRSWHGVGWSKMFAYRNITDFRLVSVYTSRLDLIILGKPPAEAAQLSASGGRDGLAYHHQQQQQHKAASAGAGRAEEGGGGGGECAPSTLTVAGPPNPVGRPRKRPLNTETTTPIDKSANQNKVRVTHNNTSTTVFPATKEQPARKRPREVFPSVPTGVFPSVSNVHTLKPGHIIAWYIDYLIHENEDRTQISRAFTLPVNLFHTDDFYFLDSLRKKVRFPSQKFLAWMQRHLPSLNAHAIDFREGRPAGDANPGSLDSGVGCYADWSWHNKTKRDIIHDVFFFFQHRKVRMKNGQVTFLTRDYLC